MNLNEKMPLTHEAVETLLKEKKYSEIKSLVIGYEPEDIAVVFEELTPKSATAFFRLLPKETAAECFATLEPGICRSLIESFSERELSVLVAELFFDDTVDLIEEMPANVVKKILRSASPADRETINQLLGYRRDSAGSLMTTEYVRLLPEMTVADALLHIRKVALDSETVYTCYVTDSSRRLIGVVTAKELLITPPEVLISEIMNTFPIFTDTSAERKRVVEIIKKYNFLALPVVDNERRLVGIVTIDDALDVMSEEAEDDFAKMAAITPSDGEYLKTPVYKICLSRIPWLLLLLISATLSGAMLSRFEAVLPAVLVLFVPMLMGTGGNCASQASVTLIRSLSLGAVLPKDTPRVVLKELSVGIISGLILAAAAFVKVIFIDAPLSGGVDVTSSVALAVSASLALTVIAAKLVGAVLPIAVKLVGLDPAVMASPFITTLVDALSLLVYFLIARSILI